MPFRFICCAAAWCSLSLLFARMCRCMQSFMVVLLMGLLPGWGLRTSPASPLNGFWLPRIKPEPHTHTFKHTHTMPDASMQKHRTVVGWTRRHTRTYLLRPFVYQWWWIYCFSAISFECYLWNYERQPDHKVEHHHGIYCKRFGNIILSVVLSFSPLVMLNQHLFSIMSMHIRVCILFLLKTSMGISSINDINSILFEMLNDATVIQHIRIDANPFESR